MSLQIRKGTQNDMPSVLQLIQELADFENESDAVEISVNDLLQDGFGEKPAFEVHVAELDGEIVGLALFYQRYSTWKGKAIHLEDLIVRENYRGKGIGKALYTSVLKYAYDLGLKRVAWEVLDWNTPAIDFYESTGAEILEGWRVVHMNENGLKNFMENK
jgi:GNAT superfamily N-acetyltransferase